MSQNYQGKPQHLQHKSPYSHTEYVRVDEAQVTNLSQVVAWELCNSTHLCKCASQCRWAVVPRH